MDRFFAIVNPAAGGGRSARLAGPALARLREKGLRIDVIASTGQGHAVQLAREAYEQGYGRCLAVGGDGTAHEILNGVFPRRTAVQRVALGFLPLGTGNSFLRDFAKDGAAASMQALLEGRTRTVDLMRLTHATGEIYSFNLLSMAFTADVAPLTNPVFKPFADLGYLLAAFLRRRGWTSSYEESLAGDSQRHSLDTQHPAFFHRCADAGAAGNFSRCAQTRLAATDFLPANRVSVERARGGSALPWFRCQPDVFFYVQPCESFRSLHAVLRHSAVCARMGARVALQNSGVRLADEALRQRPGSGCAASVGFEAHVAADAGCR